MRHIRPAPGVQLPALPTADRHRMTPSAVHGAARDGRQVERK